MLGVQIDARAPTVDWTSGQWTVLPFLPKVNRNGRLLNVLENDARFTQDLAKLPEAGPSSALVVQLDKNMSKIELFKAAREALSLNKAVLVKGFIDVGSFDFTLKDLEEHFMISPHRQVEVHGTSQFSGPFASQ